MDEIGIIRRDIAIHSFSCPLLSGLVNATTIELDRQSVNEKPSIARPNRISPSVGAGRQCAQQRLRQPERARLSPHARAGGLRLRYVGKRGPVAGEPLWVSGHRSQTSVGSFSSLFFTRSGERFRIELQCIGMRLDDGSPTRSDTAWKRPRKEARSGATRRFALTRRTTRFVVRLGNRSRARGPHRSASRQPR